MSGDLTPRALTEMMLDTSGLLDEAQAEHERWVRESVEADQSLRMALAKAYMNVEGRNAEERKARVEATCATELTRADLAERMLKASLEAIRNKRQNLSALQSMSNAVRAEFDLARTGPEYGP